MQVIKGNKKHRLFEPNHKAGPIPIKLLHHNLQLQVAQQHKHKRQILQPTTPTREIHPRAYESKRKQTPIFAQQPTVNNNIPNINARYRIRQLQP